MAIFLMRGCVISSRTIWDNAVSIEVHLNPKVQESVKNGLDMADFTIERLCDSFGDCLGECGNLRRSFEPKMTRIG